MRWQQNVSLILLTKYTSSTLKNRPLSFMIDQWSIFLKYMWTSELVFENRDLNNLFQIDKPSERYEIRNDNEKFVASMQKPELRNYKEEKEESPVIDAPDVSTTPVSKQSENFALS